jgi:predicted ester cyclase
MRTYFDTRAESVVKAVKNEEIFKEIIEGFSRGDTSVVEKFFSPDFIENQFDAEQGTNGPKGVITFLHHNFSKFFMKIEDMAVSKDGNTVWGRMIAGGIHKTGRKIELTVIDIIRFESGKAVEHWGVPDRYAMMKQLGLLEAE